MIFYCFGRNGESPIKGIDTLLVLLYSNSIASCRNGESPIKGIDTLLLRNDNIPFVLRRNGESPIKGIIKKVTQTMIKSPFKAVKW